MFDRIGLITNNSTSAISLALCTLADYLARQNKVVVVNPYCAALLSDNGLETVEDNEIGAHCDLVIAIGGDGTMLMVSRLVCQHNVALLGINLGRIGFLSDIPADSIVTELDRILAGEFIEDKRFLLHAQVFRGVDCIHTSWALNDVIIQKWNIARLVELETYIDGLFVGSHRSDGLIVSTPTGSTAYALSGGGPILLSSLDALVLVPICPHTLSNRPIVVEGNSKIEVVVGTRALDHARLTCDGEIKLELAPGDRIHISKQDKHVRLIHPASYDQFQTLREKLHWSK